MPASETKVFDFVDGCMSLLRGYPLLILSNSADEYPFREFLTRLPSQTEKNRSNNSTHTPTMSVRDLQMLTSHLSTHQFSPTPLPPPPDPAGGQGRAPRCAPAAAAPHPRRGGRHRTLCGPGRSPRIQGPPGPAVDLPSHPPPRKP